MDFRFTVEEDHSRAEVRDFLQRVDTSRRPRRSARLHHNRVRERLAAKGWLTMAWPMNMVASAGYIQNDLPRGVRLLPRS
jgi:alkylation response protein AidB-like acyl-CoA dehydrogenase